MLGSEDKPEQAVQQVPVAQPALAVQMLPHLWLTGLGTAFAALATGAGIAAVASYPRPLTGLDRGLPRTVTALVCAATMLAICTFQLVAWQLARAAWNGRRVMDLTAVRRVSWFAHLGSYLVVLVGLWACIGGAVAIPTQTAGSGGSAPAALLLGANLLCTIAAQSLAGVQYLRDSGPPGTIPMHLRRMNNLKR
jgi:hypothetical protein